MAAFLWSCNQSDPAPKGDYVQGVFVINEGNFSQNNGAVSYFAREQNTAEADLFSKVNGRALGGGIEGQRPGRTGRCCGIEHIFLFADLDLRLLLGDLEMVIADLDHLPERHLTRF